MVLYYLYLIFRHDHYKTMMAEAGTRPRSLRERGFLSAGPVDVEAGMEAACVTSYFRLLFFVFKQKVLYLINLHPTSYNQQVQLGAARPQTNRKIDKTY